jgi:hypothetical protein
MFAADPSNWLPMAARMLDFVLRIGTHWIFLCVRPRTHVSL